ncbi:MAG: VTT domain-containing protein [Actinobacteria bacterium]|nr:VTT domain-containing protein [Actinomycetota bacterium]
MSASPATYAVVFAVVAVDALLPFVQAEAVVITAAVLAAQGHLLVWLVAAVAAAGGFAGDNAAYLLGNQVGCRLAGRVVSKRRLQRAERGIRARGATLVLIARFIPVGRTATTLAAGTLDMPWRRFLIADAIAATLWAAYATALGYLGGSSFSHNLWKPLLFALALAAVLAGAAEGYRQLQKHRGKDILSGELH